MNVTAVCIQSIGTDPVALSAMDTLVRKMGYGDVLVSLWREEAWILVFAAEATEACEATRFLAEQTGIFVNPNTHRHIVVVPGDTLPHGADSGREGPGLAVWAYEDTQIRPVGVAVRERMGMRNLVQMERLVLWWPGFAGGAKEQRSVAAIVDSMAATHSRKDGLLANPHYQAWCKIERAHTPAEVLGIMRETVKAKKTDVKR